MKHATLYEIRNGDYGSTVIDRIVADAVAPHLCRDYKPANGDLEVARAAIYKHLADNVAGHMSKAALSDDSVIQLLVQAAVASQGWVKRDKEVEIEDEDDDRE